MPYPNNSDLPENIRNVLPVKAQTIFRNAFNSALEQERTEEVALKIAWSAVKRDYKKDEDGNWVEKGYVVKSEQDELQYTLGIVYEPYEVDLQGDWTDEEEIRKAAWDYMQKVQNNPMSDIGKSLLSAIKKAYEEDVEIRLDIEKLLKEDFEKRFKDMHQDWLEDGSYIVESYLAPCDFEIDDYVVKKGTWLLGVKWSDEMYEKIKKGERTGFSMGGTGDRV